MRDFVSFIFLICGASRLARFNISINPQPRNPGRPGKKYFVGMPIPAGAGVICSVIHLQRGSPIDNPWIALVWLCLLLFTSFLMVSNWRFWSAKELTTGGRHPFQLVRGHCAHRHVDRSVSPIHVVYSCNGVSGFRCGRKIGVFVGPEASPYHRRESGVGSRVDNKISHSGVAVLLAGLLNTHDQ